MDLVRRGQWEARPPAHRSPIGDVEGCTGHWNGPRVGALSHGQCFEKMRAMQDFHMDVRGWSDLGYNFVVCRHGATFEGRGLGVRGAHEEDLNHDYYGIQAMVGQGDDIPAELLAGIADTIRYCRRHGAGDRINGHRDADATECPGDELQAWLHGTPLEEDMPLTRDDVDRVARAVWFYRLGATEHWPHDWQARTHVRNQSVEVRRSEAALRGRLDALTKAVEQLAAGQGVDVEAVKAAAEDGVNAALADYTLTLDVQESTEGS